MLGIKQLARAGAALALLLSTQSPALAQPASASPLVISVDFPDQANQQPFPPFNRLFEYTDFFTRQVTIHSGDVLDFRAAPGSFHIVALAVSEDVARKVYPVALVDAEDPIPATASGEAKIEFGPSNFPITGGSTHGGGQIAFNNGFGPPVCGVAALGEKPCTFSGGDDVEVIGPNPGFDAKGNPAFVDQLIKIDAPAGTYSYFCYIHPGMRGTLTVADAPQPATTQAEIDTQAKTQFATDQAEALAAEKAANVVRFTGGDPGTRTYQVMVGVAGGDHVRIDEMLPTKPLTLVPGDQVQYVWTDPSNLHTVTFPTGSSSLPEPFGFDCGHAYVGIPATPGAAPPKFCVEAGSSQPEVIGDPGNAPSGSALGDPAQVVGSGVLVGSAFTDATTAKQWSLVINGATKPGAYNYQCTIHDWMQGTLNVQAGQLPGPIAGSLVGNSGGAFAYYELDSSSGKATTITLSYGPASGGQAHAIGFNVFQNGKQLGGAHGLNTGLGDSHTTSDPSVTVTPSASGGPVLVQVYNYSSGTITYTISSS